MSMDGDEAAKRKASKELQKDALDAAYKTFYGEAARRNGADKVRMNNIKAGTAFGLAANTLAACKIFSSLNPFGSKAAVQTVPATN